MIVRLPTVAAEYLRSINDHDVAAFDALFSASAVVNDAGREFHGASAINKWSDHEIFAAQVQLELIDAVDNQQECVIMTQVDGNFDRTGLPDPLVIHHSLVIDDGKIVQLTCKLAP